jgi:NAD(P)-dependent dehydrogenase (short-subunit alcohol dehydrogenase family)
VIETALTGGPGEGTVAANIGKTPLGRSGKPEDVASAIRFLAGDRCAPATELGIDGGLVR